MVQRGKAAARAAWHARWFSPALAMVLIVGLIAGAAFAVNRGAADFEVDGDLTTAADLGETPGPQDDGLDWSESDADEDDGALTFNNALPVSLTNPSDNPTTPGTATFFRDDLKLGGDETTFTQGSKQNDVTAAQTGTGTLTSRTNYPIVSGSIPPNKVDLFDVLTHTLVEEGQADGVIGLVRTEDNGSASYSIEINAVGFEPCPTTVTDPKFRCLTRTEGDILINADVTVGGTVGDIRIFRWDLPGGIDGGGEGRGTGGGVNCAGNLSGGNPTGACPWEEITVPSSLYAVLNQVAVPAGEWGSLLPNGNATDSIVPFGFLELYIDFTDLGFVGCPGFSQAHVKSRSSGSSGDSALQDLAGPFPFDLNTCGKITGTKYKDANGDGSRDTSENSIEVGLEGWTIELYRDDDLVATAETDEDGNYEFDNLEAGDYEVCEVPQDNWDQTEPDPDDDECYTVTIGTEDVTGVDFGNTPLSKVEVSFFDLTGSTDATITCVNEDDDEVGDLSSDSDQPESVVTADGLKIGTYTCTVEITDP